MKKQLSVINLETQAFDNHKVTLQGPDATVKLHLHDRKEFDSLKEGDKVTLTIEKGVKPTAPKKAVAKKQVKTAPVVETPVVPKG